MLLTELPLGTTYYKLIYELERIITEEVRVSDKIIVYIYKNGIAFEYIYDNFRFVINYEKYTLLKEASCRLTCSKNIYNLEMSSLVYTICKAVYEHFSEELVCV